MSAILYVYPGGYGLPTIDPKCLQLVFYLRLHPYNNIILRTVTSSTSPQLPALWYKSKLITKYQAVVEQVEELCGLRVNRKFNNDTKATIAKLKEMNTRLESPVFLNFWADELNAEYFTDIYSTGKPTKARTKFERALRIFNKDTIKTLLHGTALETNLGMGMFMLDKYLEFLSVLIGQNTFIFGDIPSSYDGYICGYLAPILTYEFPKADLKKLLLKYEVLVQYVRNFLALYGEEGTDIEVREKEDSMLSPMWLAFAVIIIVLIALHIMYVILMTN